MVAEQKILYLTFDGVIVEKEENEQGVDSLLIFFNCWKFLGGYKLQPPLGPPLVEKTPK